MAFADTQTKALKAKLLRRHVKTRESNGSTLSYVEGWHAVAEANRIFGFDSWDRQTLSPQCQWTNLQSGHTVCFYSTKVRITVRAGGTVTIREGIGTGHGRSPQADIAHDVALKAAETDATKRALATFGNPFGLALYDRGLSHVTKPKRLSGAKDAAIAAPDMVLVADGQDLRFTNSDTFVGETLRQIAELSTVEGAYAFWSANLAAFTELRRRTDDRENDPTQQIIEALKTRVRQIRPAQQTKPTDSDPAKPIADGCPDSARSCLIPKEKRIRDREHLSFVASQPCLICGRRPAQAHHLRFAQRRGMGLKVSDEYTVPVCNTHHDDIHRTGDERAWWARHGIIEPLKYAERLWAASRKHRATAIEGEKAALDPFGQSEFTEPYLGPGSIAGPSQDGEGSSRR